MMIDTFKKFVRTILFSIATLFCLAAVYPKKAVFETSDKEGFKVTEKALKNIGVETLVVKGTRSIPVESLVNVKDQVGVYRLRKNWFKLVFITFEKRDGNNIAIKSGDISDDDAVVVKGAALLRVADMDAFGGEE